MDPKLPVGVRVDGSVDTQTAKARAMFALHSSRPVEASYIADRIWPEHQMTGQGAGDRGVADTKAAREGGQGQVGLRRDTRVGTELGMGEDMSIQDKEGWGYPLNSRKAHYFNSNRSLCGKWGCLNSMPLENNDHDHSDNCMGCRRKRDKLEADAKKRTDQ